MKDVADESMRVDPRFVVVVPTKQGEELSDPMTYKQAQALARELAAKGKHRVLVRRVA